MSISQNFPNTRPSLNLNFARSKTLDPRITFTRTSSATYVDESGFIRDAVADEPRFDHDPVTGECLGLLVEEERSNLITYSVVSTTGWSISSSTLTNNATTAPDGTNTAARIQVSGGGYVAETNIPVSAGTTYTFSFWLKSVSGSGTWGINIYEGSVGHNRTTVNITEEWQRVSYTYTPTGTQVNVYVSDDRESLATISDGYVWGAQLEAGAFPTSYILTSGSTATRNPDNVSMEGDNFSDWYNPSEGTIFYDQTVISYPSTAVSAFYTFSDGTGNNRISGFIPTGSNHRLRIDESGSNTYLANAVFAADVLSPARVALAFKTNDTIGAYNGLIGFLDDDVTIPSVNRLNFGEFNGNLNMSTRIKKFTFWPQRLPDQILQTLTK